MVNKGVYRNVNELSFLSVNELLLFLIQERRRIISRSDMVLYFFSSRRRHTRFDCDWSSDVCSSDLLAARLDRLDPDERAVLERAAVAGKEFWRSGVAELSPADEGDTVGARLLALVRDRKSVV